MNGKTTRGAYGLAQRDKALAGLKSRLSLARTARNQPEITRIEKQVKRLAQSCGI